MLWPRPGDGRWSAPARRPSGPLCRCSDKFLSPRLSDYSQRIEDFMIGQVRSFNRAVTQRIGALNDAFLGRGLPLVQARVLWEIGQGSVDVRALRSRLDLDSGYLSRLLR